jgi:NitT/TauT family transport system ATP-binding protein
MLLQSRKWNEEFADSKVNTMPSFASPASQGDNRKTKIAIERARKVYKTQTGEILALEDVSATIKEGEFVCIVGPSGCGKTTLLWAMSGLHPLTTGAVLLDGAPVRGAQSRIGMVFQEANLLPWRSIIKNILYPLEIKGLQVGKYQSLIDRLLDKTGLRGFENKFPRELSGGMQQRASLVRCLSFDPSVMLLDEPFGALDAFTREEMNLLLLDLWAEQKKTIVFVTHSIPEAIFMADRVLLMTPRPGRLTREILIDLPRPRTPDMQATPYFVETVKDINNFIRSSVQR